jgi:hypothetical protein
MAMMTVEEKRDRAATRAGEAHLPVYRIPFGYAVPSGRLSDVAWVVALSAGEPRCDCPGFVYHGACIHSETVRRYLGQAAPPGRSGSEESWPAAG